MIIGDLLTMINGSYLIALAVFVGLVVEVIKQQWVATKYLALVASGVGFTLGIIIGVIYQESLVMTSFNGLLVGLLAAGGFDVLKELRSLQVFK